MQVRVYPMRQRGRRLPWREIENGPSFVGALISYTTKHGESTYSVLALQSGNPAEKVKTTTTTSTSRRSCSSRERFRAQRVRAGRKPPRVRSALFKNGSVEIRNPKRAKLRLPSVGAHDIARPLHLPTMALILAGHFPLWSSAARMSSRILR